MKKILITGVNGFVGGHLEDYLKNDFDIYGMDRCQTKDDNHHFVCDITNIDLMKKIFNEIKPDIVIHLAAIVHKNNADTSESNYNFINYECSKVLFDLCKEHNTKVIYASTIEVYGSINDLFIDETTDVCPESFYAKSKYNAEKYLKQNNLNYFILRFAPLYGKEFTLNVDKRVYLKKDKIAYCFKNGEYSFDFCSIYNVCKTIYYLCSNSIKSDTFIISDSSSISAKQIIEVNKKRNNIIVIKLPYHFSLLALSILNIFSIANKDFFFSTRNFKKLFISKHYSNKKINDLVFFEYNYERTIS